MKGAEDVIFRDCPGRSRPAFCLRLFLRVSGIRAQAAAGFRGQGIRSQDEPGAADAGQPQATLLDKIPSRKMVHRPLLQ